MFALKIEAKAVGLSQLRDHKSCILQRPWKKQVRTVSQLPTSPARHVVEAFLAKVYARKRDVRAGNI